MIENITDISSFEEDLPDRIRDSMKAWFQHIPLPGDDQQKVVTNGYPYLCEDGIHGGAVKCLDMKVLEECREKM